MNQMTLQHFLFAVSGSTGANSKDTNHLPLMDQLPPFWAKSSTDIGRIHSTPPIKIQIDPSKPFPRGDIRSSSNKDSKRGSKEQRICKTENN